MITYKSTNTSNGKFYIGSSQDLASYEKRKQSHFRNKLPYPFQRALQANPEAFEWEYVEDDQEEPILEQALLDVWFGKEQCYNLNKHADRPMPVPTEISKKIAAENQALGRGIYDPNYLNSDKYILDRVRGGKNRVKNCRANGEDSVSHKTREAQLRACGKPVVVVFPDGSRVICPSIQKASSVSGCSAPCLRRAINTRKPISKGAAKGFRFEYFQGA
jgi:hypothetical protein